MMVVTPSPILFLLLLISVSEILMPPVRIGFPLLIIDAFAVIPSVIRVVIAVVVSRLPVATGDKNRT